MNTEINFRNINKETKTRNFFSDGNLQSHLTKTLPNANFTQMKSYNSNEIKTPSKTNISNNLNNQNKNEKNKYYNTITNYVLEDIISDKIKNFVYLSQKDIPNSNKTIAKSENDLISNEARKFEYLYSPRTTFLLQKTEEEKLYQDLRISFDPITIKIIKSKFKERLSSINKFEFITIIKHHLISWKPSLEDREIIIIKLLDRLFSDIDYDNKNEISWDQFTDFLMQSSSKVLAQNFNYDLRFYVNSKLTIKDFDTNDVVSYVFYIEKYNIFGIVIDGKSIISFYDGNNCKKLKTEIDVRKTQKDIDIMQIKEFDAKAKIKVELEEIEKKIKKSQFNSQKLTKNHKNSNSEEKNNMNYNINNIINIYKLNENKKRKRIETPLKLKLEIQNINNNDYIDRRKKEFNKKLTILTTCFVDEFDTLFVSSSNNKISAWQYKNGEFESINQLEEILLNEKSQNSMAILDAYLPQYTLDWEPTQKHLYTGQTDGKILMWDAFKSSKNIEEGTLDFFKGKKRYDEYINGEENSFSGRHNTSFSNFNNSKSMNGHFKNKFNLNKVKTINTKENINDFQKDKKVLSEKLILNIKNDLSRESVSCIKVLGNIQILAAGYYNGNVILWDTIENEIRKFYSCQNTSIYQIVYSESKNLVFTCGFMHDIYIYDPFIDGVYVRKLSGHSWSINSLDINHINNEMISVDIYGNIKVWDLDRFYNFQTISINENSNSIRNSNKNLQKQTNKITSNQKIIYLTKSKKFLTYGENLIIFGMDVSFKNPELCDNQVVLGCFYNAKKFLFLTVCLKKIKLWNMLNGKLTCVYDNFLKTQFCEITSFCTDDTINRLYLGDSCGHIICMNIQSGIIIKEFSSHNSVIIAVYHCSKNKVLISLSDNNLIKIHCDKHFNQTKIIKEFYMESLIITTINYIENYSRLIIGSKQGLIRFFDVKHLKYDINATENNNQETFFCDSITNILPFDTYPICLYFQETCNAKFIIIPPHNWRYATFGLFNTNHIKDGTNIKCKIISSIYNKKLKKIFTGDILGFVNCYSIDNVLKIFDENNNVLDNTIFKKLENIKININFSISAHKEAIKHLALPNIIPEIIITTSMDRKVKLFSIKGEYIDSLSQSSINIKQIPIGIKYYLTDPFTSKLNNKDEPLIGVVFRKDILEFKNKKNEKKNVLNKLRTEGEDLISYVMKITEFDAKEKLYLLTKKCKLSENQSTEWNYDVNLNYIRNNESDHFIQNYKEVNEIDKNNFTLGNFINIYSNRYKPRFLSEMSDEKKTKFSEELNNKLRKVQLGMVKIKSDTEKFKDFEKTQKLVKKINLKKEIELFNKKESELTVFKSPRVNKLNSNRKDRLGIEKVARNPKEWFEKYKEIFNKNVLELENNILLKTCKHDRNLFRGSNNLLNTEYNSRNRVIGSVKKNITNYSLLPYISKKADK